MMNKRFWMYSLAMVAVAALGVLTGWAVAVSQAKPHPEELYGRVETVLNGEEFVLITRQGERYQVRLSGISTPRGARPDARASREALQAIISGYSVSVDVVKIDGDHAEGHVWLGSIDVAERLIMRGKAKANSSAPTQLRKAQGLFDSMYPRS